jgi:hypothetical protein
MEAIAAMEAKATNNRFYRFFRFHRYNRSFPNPHLSSIF